MLEPTNLQLPIKTQTELLGMSYSSLFYRPVPPSPREIAIKHRIDRIYTEHPYYGSRRICVVLNREMPVSRPTVQHYMLRNGHCRHCAWPKYEQTGSPAPDLPIFAAECHGCLPQPYLGHRYHLHPLESRLAVSGGCTRLVFKVHRQLAFKPNARTGLRTRCGG